MSYNIGPKIGIDGEREFRNQIKNINDSYKALEAETKAVTSAFDAQGDEQGKLEASAKQLHKQIDMQKQKMALLEDAVSKATAKYGENSAEATRLKGALYDTQSTISGLESELKDARTRLNQAGEAMEDFEDSSEGAGSAAIDFGDILKANVISDVIMDGLRQLASLVKDFAVGSIETTAEMKAATAQFEQTFGTLEEAARDSLESISDNTNIASTRMQGSFTKIYAFAKTAGAESHEALTVASRAMVAAADNAAYYDKSIEEATEQIQAFLKGNYANDAALGIAATETTRNTKANELYAKSFKELSESQKVDVLLAMVEAGNEASGAIGQAARESDAWENVTGELAEVMRLLQAEAGKPALKKLIPVIQKVTKYGYELIEDIDWDAFGETVENIVDSAIEKGPGIVNAIAAVTSAIVGMKAASKIVEITKLAKSFISVGTAATTAGTMVAASGAVASATPWGLVATVIGGAVSLITYLATQTEDTVSDLEKSMERLESSMERANTNYQETKTDIDGAASAASYYVGRLRELEKAGLDSAVAHKEYEMVVEQLNELIPDLNLTIDEQTGLIDRNVDALKADIDAWKKNATEKAVQDKFTDVLEAQGRAEADLITAQAELNILQKKATGITQKITWNASTLAESTEALEEAETNYHDSLALGNQDSEYALKLYQEAYMEVDALKRKQEELTASLLLNQAEQEELSADIEAANLVVGSYSEQVALAEESLRLFNEQTVAAEEDQQLLTEDMQAVKTSLEELSLAYDDAKFSARDSIDKQIGLFDEVASKSDWSAKTILENWKSQRSAFDEYSENLQKAVDLGLDETLIKQLSDGSAESMQILDAMVGGTQKDIDKFNAEFARTEASRNALAETMAGINTDVNNSLDKIIQDAKDAGLEISEGAAEGVKLGAGSFLDAIGNMGKQGIDWFETIFDINSPSRIMRQEGVDIVGGAAGGVEDNAAMFERSMESLASIGYDAFLQERLNRAESYPDMVNASTVSNSTTNTNYGGFTFQIYQQPGESAEDLYYRFMDMMQHEIAAKEAGL